MIKDPWDTLRKEAFIREESIRRSPLYRQEFETAFEEYRRTLPSTIAGHPYKDLREGFNLSDIAKELCERGKLPFALRPDDELWSSFPDASLYSKDPGNSVKVIPHEKTNFIPQEGRIDYTRFISSFG